MRMVSWSLVVAALAVCVGTSAVSLVRAEGTPPAQQPPAAATGSIIGKVVDPDGKPVSGAMVAVRVAHEKEHKKKNQAGTLGGGDAPKGGDKGDKGGHGKNPNVAEGLTNADGTFKIDSVPVGKYMVGAQAKGYNTGKIAAPLEVSAGQTVDAGVITLQAGKK